MVYPKTDEEWEELAECIVTRDPNISPEIVGELTVDATQTIFSWYKGEERRRALVIRQSARDRLVDLGKGTGCIPEDSTLTEAHVEEMEYLLGHRHPSQVMRGRPFPKTYGDWVNLAEDIKAKDSATALPVNSSLQHISEDDDLADMSKRWLVQKAGELGIG